VRLDQLLVQLVDQLLQLVVGELDLQEQRRVHLEAAIVEIDATDPSCAAVDREDLARLGADGALEARGFHEARTIAPALAPSRLGSGRCGIRSMSG
jgi:hypothetical protein